MEITGYYWILYTLLQITVQICGEWRLHILRQITGDYWRLLEMITLDYRTDYCIKMTSEE